MTHQEQNEFDQWLEDNIDRFAEEEEDYRIQEIDQKKVKHILN